MHNGRGGTAMNEKQKEIVITLLIAVGIMMLGIGNYKVSIIICDAFRIPYHMTLSVISLGFALELTIMITFFQIWLGFIVLHKAVKHGKNARLCV